MKHSHRPAILVSALLLAISAAAQADAIPTSANVCSLTVYQYYSTTPANSPNQGSSLLGGWPIRSSYACDGGEGLNLDPASTDDNLNSELSGQIAKFIAVGMTLQDCKMIATAPSGYMNMNCLLFRAAAALPLRVPR